MASVDAADVKSFCAHLPLRRIALSATLCSTMALLAIGASPSNGANQTGPGSDFFGMNAQYVFKLSQDEWEPHLAAIARIGIGVVRTDAFWSEVEHQPPTNGQHRYDWTIPDSIIAALARHGLRWDPILDYSTPWAATLPGPSGWKSAPSDPADFAAYAAAFAARYGTGGSFWSANPSLPALPVQTYEIWNEPNRADFWPNVSGAAERYGNLLAMTLPAIRAADPAGRIAVGGLSPDGLVEFLNKIEAQHPGLIADTDAVAYHPYGTTFASTGARIRLLREWLDEHGAGALPIEITETGWATPPLSENERASRMSTLVQGLAESSCDISRIIPYTWMTFEADPYNPEEWFGIANRNATLKPTGIALAGAIEAVKAGTETAPSDPCAGLGGALQKSVVTHEQNPDSTEQSSGLSESPEQSSGPAEDGPGPTEQNPETPEQGLGAPEQDPVLQGAGSTGPDVPSNATATGPLNSAAATVKAQTTLKPTFTDSIQASPPSGRPATHPRVTVSARVLGHTVAVAVTCSQACRTTIRLVQRGGKPTGSSAGGHFLRKHHIVLRLRAVGSKGIVLRITVQIPGEPAKTLIRKLR
jgi:hypothetical protein